MSWLKVMVETLVTMISSDFIEQKSILVKKSMEYTESRKREEFVEKLEKMCEDKGYKLIIMDDPRSICHEWSLEDDEDEKIHIVERKKKNGKIYSKRF
jgi:N6-adenosine-specific RNA methylase IME4